MKIHSLLILLLSGYALCSRVLNNVRLVDHTSYAIDVITRTMNIVEEKGWCNLKLHDYTSQINDDILNTPTRGTVTYTNGFVSSIQSVDIMQASVQQVWGFNASTSTHFVNVRATMRLHDVAVGFDVIGHMQDDDQVYRYTTLFVHPLVSYAFSITRDVHTNSLVVTVQGTVPRVTSRVAEFRPKDSTSDMFLQMFDPNIATPASMLAWGPEVFQPIMHEVVTQEIPFPRTCYNC